MYIGGTDTKGYHHLLWEIVDNSVDEVINGYGSRIEVTLHKDAKSVTVERRRPRHPRRHQEAVQEVGAGAGADHAARGRQVLVRRSTSSRAACTASARRWSTRCPKQLTAEVRRDGALWEQTYERGKAVSKLRKVGAAARHRHVDQLPPRSGDLRQAGRSRAETIRFRLDAKAFLHKGLTIVFKDEAAKTTETFEHAGGIADFLTKLVADRGKAPTAPQVFYFERAGEKPASASRPRCSGPSRTRRPSART